VIEAQPISLARKLRLLGAGVLIGTPIVVLSEWFFKSWIPRYYAQLYALEKTDPVLSAQKLAEFTSVLLLLPVLSGVAVATCATILGYRVLRAGRWPLLGAKVRRRTEVVAGWYCVRLPTLAILGLFWLCASTAWVSYIQLETMFWNGYLDKKTRIGLKAISRTIPAEKAHLSIGDGTRQ